MRTHKISIQNTGKILFFALLSIFTSACGTYQAVTYDDDGIYSSRQNKPVQTTTTNTSPQNAPATNNSNVEEGFFSKKLKEYEQLNNENVVFTDVENYSSESYTENYNNPNNTQNREVRPGWGGNYTQGSNTNVYLNSGWGFNNFQPFWNPGFRNFYGNRFGYGPFFNNFYHPFGGFYNGFYGGGFYGNGFYGGGFYNGFYGYNRPYAYNYYRSRRNTRTYRPRATRSSSINSRSYNARNSNTRTYTPRSQSTNRTYTPRSSSSSSKRTYSPRSSSSNRTYTPRSSSSNRTYTPRSSSSSSRSYSPRSSSSSSRSYTPRSSGRSSGGSYRRR
ncbi:hypothetical protein [Aquimarina agarilytica]|uniref:hypothetical protein n=1 Tax=Aquimarina agarilytica TaxID=1087449 RepID=UPI0002880DD1|nr:hypothetical protein [Aquimarina agarilytica]